MKFIAVLTALFFLFLSLFHVYWSFGGKFGLEKAIPQIDGKPALQPGFHATIAIACALLICAVVAAILGFKEYFNFAYTIYLSYVGWFLAAVFILRAIGDFRLVGFFKSVKNSKFARYDSLLYSPLCLILGVIFILLAYNKE